MGHVSPPYSHLSANSIWRCIRIFLWIAFNAAYGDDMNGSGNNGDVWNDVAYPTVAVTPELVIRRES